MLDVFDLTPGRPAGDVLSRVIRVSIGGTEYELPVRSIKANREFREGLEAGTNALLAGLDSPDGDLSAIYAVLASQLPTLLDLLISYDTAGILPSRDVIEAIEPDCSFDIVAAVREVWRAANPLVAMSLRVLATTPEPDSSPPTNTPPKPTASARRKSSRKN